MASYNPSETGFSESDVHFACETFYRDCPNGYCSKQKFLTYIPKFPVQATLHKSLFARLIVQTVKTRHNYRRIRKFFSMMFDIYDQNHDGQLDFDEYIYALSALTGTNSLRTIETLYKFFDTNNQGYVTPHEFNSRKKLAAQFLGQYKTSNNDPLLYEQEFNTIDTNKDGRISKEEFFQWYLKDHGVSDYPKTVKKRKQIFQNLSTLVDIHGQIKISTVQHLDNNHDSHCDNYNNYNNNDRNRDPIDSWVEATINTINSFDFSDISPPSTSMNAERLQFKKSCRTRSRFIQYKDSPNGDQIDSKQIPVDNQSDSGVFTSSSRVDFTDDFELNTLHNSDEDDLQSCDQRNEPVCKSLEAALAKGLLELKQHKEQRVLSSTLSKSLEVDNNDFMITRF